MPDGELTISTTTDPLSVAEAAAHGDDEGGRVPAPKLDVEKLDGSTAVSFEHPRSERTMLLERLAGHEADLEALTSPEANSEQVASNEVEPGEEQLDGEAAAEAAGIDMAAVRKAATEDAIAAARARQQYYSQQQQQHLAAPDVEQLIAQLAVPFAQRMQALRAQTPDIAELDKQSNIPIPLAVQDALLALSGGPEATLYLVRHPEEARQLQQLPEHVAVAKVAQLTARLTAKPPRRAVSQAPPPITPVGGSATRSSLPPDEMSYQDYAKFRERQIKTKYRR